MLSSAADFEFKVAACSRFGDDEETCLGSEEETLSSGDESWSGGSARVNGNRLLAMVQGRSDEVPEEYLGRTKLGKTKLSTGAALFVPSGAAAPPPMAAHEPGRTKLSAGAASFVPQMPYSPTPFIPLAPADFQTPVPFVPLDPAAFQIGVQPSGGWPFPPMEVQQPVLMPHLLAQEQVWKAEIESHDDSTDAPSESGASDDSKEVTTPRKSPPQSRLRPKFSETISTRETSPNSSPGKVRWADIADDDCDDDDLDSPWLKA